MRGHACATSRNAEADVSGHELTEAAHRPLLYRLLIPPDTNDLSSSHLT